MKAEMSFKDKLIDYRNLDELAAAGFVARDDNVNPETGRNAREARYRISDNYTRFYLKYIETLEAEIRAGRFDFGTLSDLPGWESEKGVQFENMVVNHVAELVPHLRVPMGTIRSAAPFLLKGRKGAPGVQIDLLLQTNRTVWIVEVKRQTHIGREIETEMLNKVAAFPKRRGISIRTALVYSGVLDDAVLRSGAFDAIVPFPTSLGWRAND